MAQISKDTIEKLSGLQTQLWQVVSETVVNSIGQQISFNSPLTTITRSSDLMNESKAAQLIIQFALASTPESVQTLMIRSETVLAIARMLTGLEPTDVDDNILADVRPVVEAMVQGLCLGIGRILQDTVVASSLTTRYQAVPSSPNLQRALEVVRTAIAIEGEDLSGTVTWVFDAEAAAFILGESMQEFVGGSESSAAAESSSSAAANQDVHKLDILLDVPLEITVELGRVRMTVREIVDLGTGSIVQLDRAAGEPVDLMVNGRLVARGEVVVIEDNFGVRITEVLDPNNRLNRLEAA